MAAAIGVTPDIWQASNNCDKVTMNIADLQKGIADLQTDFQHTQAIALGSAYVTMKCPGRSRP